MPSAEVTPPTPPPAPETPAVAAPAVAAEPVTVVVEPPPRRVVTREGFVRHTIHVNKPSWYELQSPDTGKIINYLFNTNVDFSFKVYKDHRVLVTGEEALDKRWPQTPVLTIDRIEIIDQ
jgi:hypothetical protein